jgi:heme-degrading monooxygenase HmoA
MFARITVMHVYLDRIDEAIELYRKSVIPEAKKQKGFRAACLLLDRSTGKGNAITFWKSEQDAIANEKNLYYQEQLVKFLVFFSAPPIREGYEVQINTFEAPAKKKSGKKTNS